MLVGEAVEKDNVGWILGWPLVAFNVLDMKVATGGK